MVRRLVWAFLFIVLVLTVLGGVRSEAGEPGADVCWQCNIDLGFPVCQLDYVGYHNCAVGNIVYCTLWPEGELCMVIS